MFKRIMKIVGLSFCGVVGVFGIIAGVMAIRGDFKKVKIKPTGLYFSADEKYFADNKLLLSPVEDTDAFYFQVKADNEDCNVLGIKLSITSGADVIKIVDKNNSPITDAKIWGDVKIIPQTQGGVNVGGTARISAISYDGLVATTSDLIVYVDVPVQDLTPSDDVADTTGDNTRKTPTRDKGLIDGKRYFSYDAGSKTFSEANFILFDGSYYDFDVNKGIYKKVTTTDTTKYLNFAELYEDCYMATMFNDNTLNIDTLYNFNPSSPNSQNPINRDGYGNKNVEAFILDEDDLQLATLSADGKTIISNGRGLTGDVRVLLAVYPTYAKQKLAEADATLSTADRIEKYMVSREIVVRIGATTIKDMVVTKKSLGLDLFEYTPVQLNNSSTTNNLGMIIRDTADNPISSIYKYLRFSFVDGLGTDANDLGSCFTISNDNSLPVSNLADNVEKESLTGSTQLYIYAKRYVPKAYMKISYVSGTETLKDVFVELVTTFTEPQISLKAGTGNINKLIDDRLVGGVDNADNIIDLSGYYTVTPESTVYRKVLYFAKSNTTSLAPENYPICVLANKTYVRGENTYYLVGYTEKDGEGNVINVETNKLKANTGSGDISIIAVVVRTDYNGKIINLNTPKVDGEYVELDLADGNPYDFNEAYSLADGNGEQKSSAMATSTLSLTVTIAYKVQNVNISLSAQLDGRDVTSEGDQYYVENEIVRGKASKTFHLRENFDGTISLYLTDCYDKSALKTAFDKSTISLSAVMYDANGEYKYTGYDSIANYITLGKGTAVYGENDVFMGYKYNVTLRQATPEGCYISFKLSIDGYAQTFPRTIANTDNSYETYLLDNVVILSGAVSKIDVTQNGENILANNGENNPLILLAKWNVTDKKFEYTLNGSSISSGENFLAKNDYNIIISPSYALIKNYTMQSSNTDILTVDNKNNITIGSHLGVTKLTISCGGVERTIDIELRLDNDSTTNITINPDNLAMASGYIEVPLNSEYELYNYANFKVGADSDSHKNLLTFSNLVVKNERNEDVTNEKVGSENKFQLIGNKLQVLGTISQKYYVEILVNAPYATSQTLKLYLHSAVSVTYADYASKNDVYQQIYSGTTFVLMNQGNESDITPLKVYVTDGLAQFGGSSGIKAVNVSTSADGRVFTPAGTITPTSERYLFAVDNSYAGNYVKFTISFNIPADDIEYVVYVNDNLLVEEKNISFIHNGTLTAYCGESYNIVDYITLKHFDEGEYTNYVASNATEIELTDYIIKEYPTFDISTEFVCDWAWVDSTLNVSYNDKTVLKIDVVNPYSIVEQNTDYTLKALTAVRLGDFITGAEIKLLKKAVVFDATATYYNAQGRKIVDPVPANIEDYFTLVDGGNYGIEFKTSDVLSSTDISVGTLNDETYIYIGKQTVAGTLTFIVAFNDGEAVRQQADVIVNVKPNLPDNFIKANRVGVSGNTIDLRDFINTEYGYDRFEWNDVLGEPVKAVGNITLAQEPFSSNDVALLSEDNNKFIAPEPTDPRGDLTLTFTVNTDFGYSEDFTVTIQSATQLIATYPTHSTREIQIDNQLVTVMYEQVVAGQTVNMFGVDADNKVTRVKAMKNGTEITTPLEIKYSYQAGRDTTDVTSYITINNGSITFNAGASALFALTISEPVSHRELLYYFYLAPSVNKTFTPTYNGTNTQNVLVDKDHTTLDIASLFALTIDGVEANKTNLQYEICYSTNTQTAITDSTLTFTESNVENDYIVVIYDNIYIYGYYNIHTIPNVTAQNTVINWTPETIGAQLANLPEFTYNGGVMTIAEINVDTALSTYIDITNDASRTITLKQFVPTTVAGVLTYKLVMMSGESEIGIYEHNVALTINARQYFADKYNTGTKALEVTAGDQFSLTNAEYNLAGLTVADNGLHYTIKEINGVAYNGQDMGVYYTEENLTFTFNPVADNVTLHFVIDTDFGYKQDLYIKLMADIKSAIYKAKDENGHELGTVSNPLTINDQFTEAETPLFVFNRAIDLANYLSITSRKDNGELLTAGNFRLTATILSDWAIDNNIAVADIYSLDGTTLTFVPLASELRLAFKVEIKMSGDTYFASAMMFYITLSANYNANVNYAFVGDTSELIENGKQISFSNSSFIAVRDNLTGVDNYNAKRISFFYPANANREITEFDYTNISASAINKLTVTVDSQTNTDITAHIDDNGITFDNATTSTIGSVTLRFKNQVGIDLTMTFKIYPTNTLDAISSIKYNGKEPSATNDHELILNKNLNISKDYTITTFGDSSSRVLFRYPANEKGEFIESLKAKSTVVYDETGAVQDCFDVQIDETLINIKLKQDSAGNWIYPAPKLYTIHFLSRAGYLGSYKFTFSQDVNFENAGYNVSEGEKIYGSQSGVQLLDRVGIKLYEYTADGYESSQIDLVDKILTSATNEYNGYSLQFESNSRYITIGKNDNGTRDDILSFTQVSADTNASVTVKVLYNGVVIASHDYNFIIQEHLIVSLGYYNDTTTVRSIDIYMRDFYKDNFYDETLPDKIEYDLTNSLNPTDDLFFTLRNVLQGKYGDPADLKFTIDTNASTSGINNFVELNNYKLVFKKDVTEDTLLVLNVGYQGGTSRKTFSITIKPSIAVSRYTDGGSGQYIYGVDNSGVDIYSLDDLVIANTNSPSNTSQAEMPKIEMNDIKTNGVAPLALYTVSKMKGNTPYTPLAEDTDGSVRVVSMEYAMFANEEALNNTSTGYRRASYTKLSVDYASTATISGKERHNNFKFTVPNVNANKIMSVKVKVRLLGGNYYEYYYFIKVNPALTLGESKKYTEFTQISLAKLKADNAVVETKANNKYTLFTANGKDTNAAGDDGALFYWTPMQNEFGFDKFKNNVVFVITNVDNGINNNVAFSIDKESDITLSITSSEDGGMLFNNVLKFRLYVLALDSKNLFEFGADQIVKTYTGAINSDTLALLENNMIFAQDVEIKPKKELGIYTTVWGEISQIHAISDLGLSIDLGYTDKRCLMDYVSVGSDTSRAIELVNGNFKGNLVSDYKGIMNGFDFTADYGWKICVEDVTVSYSNFKLTRTFNYIVSNSATFVKINYATFNDRIKMTPEINDGVYGENSRDLARSISLVTVETMYIPTEPNKKMNDLTETNNGLTISTSLGSSKLGNDTLADNRVQIFTKDTKWFTKVDNNYVEYAGEVFESGVTYYYYDEYTANYRAFDLNKYTLYAEDTTADTAGPGMNLYIDLSECLTDNIFTLPYEAWKSNSMILTFNVQVEYDGVIYKSQIRILEITAKPNLA